MAPSHPPPGNRILAAAPGSGSGSDPASDSRTWAAGGAGIEEGDGSEPFAAARVRAGAPFTRRPVLAHLTDRYGGRPPSLVQGMVGVLAAVLVGAVAWWLLRPAPAPVESMLPLASSGSSAGVSTHTAGGGAGASGPAAAINGAGSVAASGAISTTAAPQLVVQASGAVARPGVYRLPAEARVDDLVRMAGGLRPDADGDRVNLASPLADGARVWVPARGEQSPPEVVAGSGSPGAGGAGGAGSGIPGGVPTAGAGRAGTGAAAAGQVVDLNTATAEQLDTLPGVGPATATAILAYRDEHGPFASVDDLLEVRGIGDAKLEQLRSLVRV